MYLGRAEEIPISLPSVLGIQGLQPAETLVKIVLSNKPYVAELKDVMIMSKASIISTPDGCALNDALAHPLYGNDINFVSNPVILAKKKPYLIVNDEYAPADVECGIFLSGFCSDQFGHWVPEFLNKLKFYEQHPDFEKTPIIIDSIMPQSHFDYLSALVGDHPILALPDKTACYCRKLLVAPTPTFSVPDLIPNHQVPLHEINPISPSGLAWLRDRVLSRLRERLAKKERRFGRKIYLSRRNMLWRRVSNDDEIRSFLEERGFETIDIEKMSFEDQILVFRDAECIVAPNGSALTNLIFAPLTVKLIVLFQSNMYNWGCYYGPMHALGYEMMFVTGHEAMDTKHSDFVVPIQRISEALIQYEI